MEKQKITLLSNLALIVILIIMIIVMFKVISIIRTDGGKCTANPLTFSEMKLKQKYGEDYSCKCTRPTYNTGEFLNPNLTINT